MEAQLGDAATTADTSGTQTIILDVNTLPNTNYSKEKDTHKVSNIQPPTYEVVSNSDHSNNSPNHGGGNSSTMSDGSADQVTITTVNMDTKVSSSSTIPEMVVASNEEIMKNANVIQLSPKRATAAAIKRSPNRYSRMKNEISNTYYYPSKCKSSSADSTMRTSNTRSRNLSLPAAKHASPANGQHCIIHEPTLDEIQSMTFSEFVRTKVIPAAMMSNNTDTSSDEEDDEDNDDDKRNSNIHPTSTSDFDPVNTPSSNPPTPSRRDAKSTPNSTLTRRGTITRTRTGGGGGDNTTTVSSFLSSSSAPVVLREGIAKIRLPPGFFKNPPYNNDTTGRGPIWGAGTTLGDKIIHYPILQNIRGMTGVYEYTHTELPSTTIAEFRNKADKYRLHQMGSVLLEFKKKEEEKTGSPKTIGTECQNDDNDQSSGNDSTINPDPNNTNTDSKDETGELTPEQVAQLERQFWKRLSPTMPPPVYGADEPGTLFGDDDDASGWSLAKLDSCLHVLSDIPGVTSPYLYAGMWASVFCAHTEDMNLLSINYLHAGQPKIWYAVAESDAARFVSLAEHHFVHQLQKCKEFLRHKRCLLSPLILQQAGIRYQTAIQYPGDAIITFPGGYHFGFNAGFNIAEATNFGILEWLPFGRKAKICLCRPDSVRIDMNRLTYLLQRYQVEIKRNKRLTWKEWRKRYERKEGIAMESKSEIIETEDEIIEVISYAPKKRQRKSKTEVLLSEQERKNEFWIEVTLPSQLRKTNSSVKKGAKNTKKVDVKPWYLAKPVGRKRLEVNMKVLCLVPVTPTTDVQDKISTKLMEDVDVDDENDIHMNHPIVEEHCFTGTILRIEDKHAFIHFDGQCKSSDIWMPLSSTKIFINGGIWDDKQHDITKVQAVPVVAVATTTTPTTTTDLTLNTESSFTDGTTATKDTSTVITTKSVNAIPVLHYWKEMDTNALP